MGDGVADQMIFNEKAAPTLKLLTTILKFKNDFIGVTRDFYKHSVPK